MSSDSFTQQYLVIFAHMIKCNDVNETLFFFSLWNGVKPTFLV